MKFLLLFLLAQQQVSVVPAERGALLQADGGVVDVGSGTWFSTEEVIAMGKDHAGLRARSEDLQAHAADVPYKWVVGAVLVGFAVGAAVGFGMARAAPR